MIEHTDHETSWASKIEELLPGYINASIEIAIEKRLPYLQAMMPLYRWLATLPNEDRQLAYDAFDERVHKYRELHAEKYANRVNRGLCKRLGFNEEDTAIVEFVRDHLSREHPG